ncbi:antifreeze protein Maxi-like [Palaemon carinicauda]|uniref:antifreeze protein Maxi-like n=1 Tax=Palaemon carinicauda TaxID=392227 RepID=UPI0035B66E9B
MKYAILSFGIAAAKDTEEETREKRGYIADFISVGEDVNNHRPSAADIANQAAAEAIEASIGLEYAGKTAAAEAASAAAAVAAAASQTAQAAAYDKQVQAAKITQAVQKAQEAAFIETSLAAESSVAEKASNIAAAMSKELLDNMEQLLAELNAQSTQSDASLNAQEDFLNTQSSMAWQTQKAANILSVQQAITLHELASAMRAAEQATTAARKARTKAKGANALGFRISF